MFSGDCMCCLYSSAVTLAGSFAEKHQLAVARVEMQAQVHAHNILHTCILHEAGSFRAALSSGNGELHSCCAHVACAGDARCRTVVSAFEYMLKGVDSS